MQLAGQGRPLLMPALRDAVLFQVTFKCARKTLWEGKLLRSQEDGMCGTTRLNLKVITAYGQAGFDDREGLQPPSLPQ